MRRIFQHALPIGSFMEFKQATTLGDNNRFLRLWHEIEGDKMNKKWFPCLKGGSYRKWYGNYDYVVNWGNGGSEVKSTGKATIRSQNYLFKPGLNWSRITTGNPSFRIMEKGYFFESASGVCFPPIELRNKILAFLNSKISSRFAQLINPTLTFQSGNLSLLPLLQNVKNTAQLDVLAEKCIDISKKDWDAFETSSNFMIHPLLNHCEDTLLLSKAFAKWSVHSTQQFKDLKAAEEELNRIFITLYDFNELSPDVQDEEISIRQADLQRDMKSFLSYAVGCMLGRYSLDQEGLIFTGGEFDASKYKTFKAD